MSHESKLALERIVSVCNGTEGQIDRLVRIYDIALEGLGMVHSQRIEIVEPWRQAMIQKRRDSILARQEKAEKHAAKLTLVAA